MHQVRIVRVIDNQTVWVNGGWTDPRDAYHAAELQLIGRDESAYRIEVEAV